MLLAECLLIAKLDEHTVFGFNFNARSAFREINLSGIFQSTSRFSQLCQSSKESSGSEEGSQDGFNEKRQNLGNDIQKKFFKAQNFAPSLFSKPSLSQDSVIEPSLETLEGVETGEKNAHVSSDLVDFMPGADKAVINTNNRREGKKKSRESNQFLNSTANKNQATGQPFRKRSRRLRKGTIIEQKSQNSELQKSSKQVFDKNPEKPSKRKNATSDSSSLPSLNGPEVQTVTEDRNQPDMPVGGLSSWEEFLGSTRSDNSGPDSLSTKVPFKFGSNLSSQSSVRATFLMDETKLRGPRDIVTYSENFDGAKPKVEEPSAEKSDPEKNYLPSIQDLFPMDLSTVKEENQNPTKTRKMLGINASSNMLYGEGGSIANLTISAKTNEMKSVANILQGISPVADLFYRSSQAQNQEDDGDDDDEHDDEELPFSAEQTDSVTSDHNKIRIRRNMVQPSESDRQIGKESNRDRPSDGQTQKTGTNGIATGSRGRKMVRRGMEMLVGGIPINADPPQRSVELFYDAQQCFDADNAYADWASTISINQRDFGPLWHAGSISKILLFEKGLFCEHFCHSTIKWNVCPNDLRAIVEAHDTHSFASTQDIDLVGSNPSNGIADTSVDSSFSEFASTSSETVQRLEPRTKVKGFSKDSFTKRNSSLSEEVNDIFYNTKGTFAFEIAISKEELESGEGGRNGGILKAVFARAFLSVLERSVQTTMREVSERFTVEIPSLVLTETEYGFTSVAVEFKVEASYSSNALDLERRLKRIGSVFTQAIDDGEIALAVAAAAKEEKRWPVTVRERVVEECLFQDDDGDGPLSEKDGDSTAPTPIQSNDDDVQTSVKLEVENETSDLFIGGGDDGVFFDYSSKNAANSPYGGKIGLRLVDAVVERARQRQPKVIAVGDVHGCVDELQDLLRECDYSPGDLVVLLGDLVCKGPDSVAVVQMAREIGAIGVRGNHDFEVIRWHQAIKSGVDPPVVGSEHFHIASCLSTADMKWMYSLPWYISSKDLGCLFVHAGFVSGIRLAKQNPRLMMNMRSILPDGTVTSKFFNNWPWARLWDGPQTVLFGHDADRGLQQYEHALGLDTGCVYGGRLTACILPEKRLVSVSARREYFKYRRKHYD